MASNRQLKEQELIREKILNTAREILEAKGLEKVSIREVLPTEWVIHQASYITILMIKMPSLKQYYSKAIKRFLSQLK